MSKTLPPPTAVLLLDNFLPNKPNTGDALLFKGLGVYSTENVLSKHLLLSKCWKLKSNDWQKVTPHVGSLMAAWCSGERSTRRAGGG